MTSPLGPEWLAHRYDPGHDAVHLLRVPRETRRKAPFLTDSDLGPCGDPVIVRREDAPRGAARVNFVFHSAYCCSTLVANAYDRPGAAFSLKEPVLLNDLVGWRHRGAAPDRLMRVIDESLALLARPFAPDERCVIKPSNVVNGLAPTLVRARPDAGVLLLYAPLRVYLASIAGKGLWGRLWVRELLSKQLVDGYVDLGFDAQAIFLQSDLQVAALGWLAQHKLFARIAATWPARVRTLDSEVLVARPVEALRAIDALFGVAGDDAARDAIVATVFARNAKTGDAFGAEDRREARETSVGAYGAEIEMVTTWAAEVARAAGVTLDAPLPLLG